MTLDTEPYTRWVSFQLPGWVNLSLPLTIFVQWKQELINYETILQAGYTMPPIQVDLSALTSFNIEALRLEIPLPVLTPLQIDMTALSRVNDLNAATLETPSLYSLIQQFARQPEQRRFYSLFNQSTFFRYSTNMVSRAQRLETAHSFDLPQPKIQNLPTQ